MHRWITTDKTVILKAKRQETHNDAHTVNLCIRGVVWDIVQKTTVIPVQKLKDIENEARIGRNTRIPKLTSQRLTNADSSTGICVNSVAMADAKRVQDGKEHVTKERERKKEEDTSKKVNGLLDRRVAFDNLKQVCSTYSDLSTAFNAKSTKADLLLKAYQYLGGMTNGLKNKKKETIIEALLTEFSIKFDGTVCSS